MEQEIIRLGNLYEQHDRWGVIDTNGICGTLTAAMGMGGGHVLMIIVRKDKKCKNLMNGLKKSRI